MATFTTAFDMWSSYYTAQCPAASGPLKTIDNKPNEVFDTLPSSITYNENNFKLYIASNKLNFMLIQGTNTISVIHYPYVYAGNPGGDRSIVGICGDGHCTPSFREIDPRASACLIEPQEPTNTRGSGDQLMIPTLKQFLGIRSKDQFQNLVGTSYNPISKLNEWPNIFIIHSLTFFDLDGAKKIQAHSTRSKIINRLHKNEDSIA
jgi:hypothetical protein